MKKGFLAGVLLFFMYFMYVGACYAIPNHFLPATNTQEALTVSAEENGLSAGWYFGVYDWQGEKSDGLLLLKGNEVTTAQFEIIQENNVYKIHLIKCGVNNNSDSLDIGNSPDFSFFFYDGNSYYDPDDISKRGSQVYTFSYSDQSGSVVGNDISAVPAPQSFILLLSGMFGLIGLTRNQLLSK